MKYLIILIILAILGGGGWYTVQKLKEEQQSASDTEDLIIQVEARTIEDVLELSGIVAPVISTEVRSEVTGRIKEVFIEDGDAVTEGQLLIELEKTELQSDVLEAERNYQAQELRVANVLRNLERDQDLFEKGFINESDFLDAETEFKIAEIELQVRQARLDKVREAVNKTGIRAPHAGIVSNFDLRSGEVIIGAESVNSGTRLMVISDPELLYVDSDVNELDVTKVKVGMEAIVRFDALPDAEFEGEVTRIAAYAQRENNERVFPVRISFVAEGSEVKEGISANIKLPLHRVVDVPAIKLSAVFRERRDEYVFVKIGEEKYHKRYIETGLRDAFNVEIVSGLKVGDEVSLTEPQEYEEDEGDS